MTLNSEGLLLFMQEEGDNDEFFNDFFALQLTSGRLLFSYNLGSGGAEIRSNGSYNDGLLHSVSRTLSTKVSIMYVVPLVFVGASAAHGSLRAVDN